jgi:hypothetical protein
MKEDETTLCNATLYRSLIEILMYLTTTGPDIMFVLNLVARFMHQPHESHWWEAKRILSSGYAFLFGGNLISWSNKKQPIVALSTTEAKYIAMSSTSTQAIWMEILFEDLGMKVNKPIKVYCDNQSTISMTKNHVFHNRSKHIDIQHHFIRDLVQQQFISFEFCRSEDQLTDIFTKALPKDKLENLRLKKLDIKGEIEIT